MNKIEEIKEYISLLENSSLSVLEIEKEDGTKIHLEKEHPAQQIFNASPIGAYQPTATDVPASAPVQHRPLRLSLPLPRKTPRL